MRKALVVDDTKSSRILVATCLEHEGYAVTMAGRGKQAVELLKAEQYDVVFLDIKMPFMSGTEIFKWMLDNGINTPVVILTAYATVKNAVECTRMGAVAYLQKPFTVDRFKELVRAIEGKIESPLQAAKRELECGSTEGAINYLRQALSEDHENSEIYFLLSRAYFLTGNKEYGEKFMKAYEAIK